MFKKVSTKLKVLGTAGLAGINMLTIGAYAAPDENDTIKKIGENSLTGDKSLDKDGITNLIITIANWLMGVVALIAVIMMIYGAFIWITGWGADSPNDAAEKGQKYLKNSVIGLIVALLSFTIVNLIAGALSGDGFLSEFFA